MQIGELFVKLGVKGADNAVGAIKGVGAGMKETASMSLEAKAAILGVMYATQRFFSESGKAGTNLTNFNSLLGVSAQTLQQYQYAARQAGVSNQETESTFKSLQGAMTKTLMGQAPSGLAFVANKTGGISAEDVKKFAEAPHLLIQKLQEYARKESNVGLRNEVLRSFGVGDGFISALNRQAFNAQSLGRAPTYSDAEIAKLDKANIAWSNLATKIEMAVGRFNALHGGQLVSDISKITDQVLKLAEAFIKLADRVKLFEGIGLAFQGWTSIFSGVTSAVGKIGDLSQGGEKAETVKSDVKTFLNEVFTGMMMSVNEANKIGADKPVAPSDAGLFASFMNDKFSIKPNADKPVVVQSEKSARGETVAPKPNLRLVVPQSPVMPSPPKTASPKVAPLAPKPANAVGQNFEINQTLNFNHDGTDSMKSAEAHKKMVKDAFRQLSSPMQGS